MLNLPPYDAILAKAIITEVAKHFKVKEGKVRVTNSAINNFRTQFAMGYPMFVVEVVKGSMQPKFYDVGVSNSDNNFVMLPRGFSESMQELLFGDPGVFEAYDAAFAKAFEPLKGKRLQTMKKMREGTWWTNRRPQEQMTASEQQEGRYHFRIQDSLTSEALTTLEKGDKVQFESEDVILTGKFLAVFQEKHGTHLDWMAKIRRGKYDYFVPIGQVEAISEQA
jgi:hypothetical protein